MNKKIGSAFCPENLNGRLGFLSVMLFSLLMYNIIIIQQVYSSRLIPIQQARNIFQIPEFEAIFSCKMFSFPSLLSKINKIKFFKIIINKI